MPKSPFKKLLGAGMDLAAKALRQPQVQQAIIDKLVNTITPKPQAVTPVVRQQADGNQVRVLVSERDRQRLADDMVKRGHVVMTKGNGEMHIVEIKQATA